MAKYELLDNITHADLRIITDRAEQYGDKVGLVRTFPTEFADIQREFPILFRKDSEEEGFYAVALLGLEKDENLFLGDSGWSASYVPAILAKDAFVIGLTEEISGGDVHLEPMLHVDMENPRVSTTEGEAVFLKHGGNSPYIEKVGAILRAVHAGAEIAKTMYARYDELGLIAPVKMEITLNKDMKRTLAGFYTIDEEKLRALDAESLYKLNSVGYLQGAYMIVASLANIKKLIDIKNARLMKEHNAAVENVASN